MNISLIAAQSLDGFIAPHLLEGVASTTWTSREDSRFFQEKSKEIGVVIMGRTTWETIPQNHRPLSDRVNIVLTSKPETVEQSSDVSEIPSFSVNGNRETFTTNLAPLKLTALLRDKGYQNLAIVGGSSVYTAYMQSGLVDTLYITIEPVVFGQGISLFDKSMNYGVHLSQVKKLSDTVIVLKYHCLK
jgi:dihydrofolate reductase